MTLFKTIISYRFLTGLCFLITTLQLSAQATISYDSIKDDGTRNDTLTFAEDFADAKYAFCLLYTSDAADE